MTVSLPEIVTQKRVINMFRDPNLLGYEYLGDWKDRENNSNIEKEYLEKFLKDKYDSELIKKAIKEIEKITTNQTKTLYQINKEVYSLLRYGIKVKLNHESNPTTVWLIDWENPKDNHFSIAEEVTIKAAKEKRPDIVLYVNGIALVVLELKKSSKSIGNGIRQNIDNQKNIFIKNFFATIQIVMAGNDSEGLQYGVINTPEKYYLKWKEDITSSAAIVSPMKELLDNRLYQMCQKERLLDIIHNFIVFEDPDKKICRYNQYFGAKEAQQSLRKEEGGILWHTQGSGKSLLMIWLAKWIAEKRDDSRVLILTDREELDDQIEGFFSGVDEKIYRTQSGKDMWEKLNEQEHVFICSLIHKFRSKDSDDEGYEEMLANIPEDFSVKGNLHIFIDECHRTQSGKLHDAMIKKLPNAIILGFTGTPLLQKDKKTTVEKFGKIIHSYKYNTAVEDGVVLDLKYIPREVKQNLTSPEKIDQWFDASTKGLTEWKKNEVKKKWATMQKVCSSKERLEEIVKHILLDMRVFPRLADGKGNAILVANDIYEACKYYNLFSNDNNFKKCAIITSYHGDINSIKGESVGANEETDKEFMYATYNKMLEEYDKRGIGNKDPKSFEKEVKELFIKKPGEMQLLIVVNKLLTGFDAPPATYIYIDKNMKDHGLFQAICRVNRLDGNDKVYGYIIDYRDLFKSLEKAVIEYTSDAFGGYEKKDVEGLLKNRITEGRKILDQTIDMMYTLCEPVKPPKKMMQFYEYFCGSTNEIDNTEKLKKTQKQRFMFYKMTSTLVRAYVDLANDMEKAGYTKDEIKKIKFQVKDYNETKEAIKLRSGETIDLKKYEPDMRYLIDNYIDAEESKNVKVFEEVPLVDLIVKSGIHSIIDFLPSKTKEDKKNSADTINANIRKVITAGKQELPKFYERMSKRLDEIIIQYNKNTEEYQTYLKNIDNLCKEWLNGVNSSEYPNKINTKPRMAFYDLLENEELAVKMDTVIIENKHDEWKGNPMKEKILKNCIKDALKKEEIEDDSMTEKIFELAQRQNEY